MKEPTTPTPGKPRANRQADRLPLAGEIHHLRLPEKPGRYFLYEVDVLQDYSLTPCIRYGNMKHLWVLRKGAHRKYTDHTDMTEIYTIFGDSTWPKSGVIAEKPSPYNNTVLVWEDALKALTVRFTGDVARERTIDTQYQKGRCYQPTENGKADHSDILALLAYGQQLFTSQNERALGEASIMLFICNLSLMKNGQNSHLVIFDYPHSYPISIMRTLPMSFVQNLLGA